MSSGTFKSGGLFQEKDLQEKFNSRGPAFQMSMQKSIKDSKSKRRRGRVDQVWEPLKGGYTPKQELELLGKRYKCGFSSALKMITGDLF